MAIREAESKAFGANTPKEIRRKAMLALQTIDPREAVVFVLRHSQRLSYKQIGEIMGVTGNRIKQVHAKALRKLSHPSRTRRAYMTKEMMEDVFNARTETAVYHGLSDTLRAQQRQAWLKEKGFE